MLVKMWSYLRTLNYLNHLSNNFFNRWFWKEKVESILSFFYLLRCNVNRLDINCSKTFAMFITKMRVKIPTSIVLWNHRIEKVNNFKLIGFNIDNKLSFTDHVASICKSINQKLFSIKRLFYLATSVKVKFFKSFILPYFDYCGSLFIYYS